MSATFGSRRGPRVRALVRLHAWKAFLVLGAALTVGYFLLPGADEQDVFYQVPEMLAVAAILAAVRLHRPRDARPWILLAAGLGLSTAGDWIWVVLDRVYGLDPFPSVADAFYLVGMGVIGLSMWLMVRGRLPDGDTAGLLDSLIVTVGAGLLTWVFLMAPVVSDTSQSTAELAVALAYPLIDILLLGALVRLVLVPGELATSLRLTVAALVAWLLADYPYALLALEDGYQVGMLVDAGWIGGAVLWGTAALHPSMDTVATPALRGEARLSPWRLVLLAAASLMAPALLLAGWAGGVAVDVPVVAAACIVLFVLVIARLQGVVADLRQTLRERRALEAELEHRALHDPLTGLANRALFHDRLAHSLARREGSVAVMFLDLDDFKTINDSLGHEAGDHALRRVADALTGVIRPEDTVARLGGDEFAVLLSGTPDRYLATRLAGRLLEAVEQPLEIAGTTRTLGVSIGIALGEAGGGVAADDLMRNADIAMYVAKQQGKRTFTVFEQAEHHGLVRGLALRNDLELAMERREFTVAYQPIVALDSGRVAGVEALVRWQHPTLGELQPEEFIPLAEATGAIVPLGRWILAESCRAAAGWGQAGWGDAWVSVNLSVQQLAQVVFLDELRAILGETGLPPERLVLEVTESARMHGSNGTDALAAVRELGVRLAIDDFGTGYAALSQLTQHRFDLVKLAASFITPLGRDGDAEALVSGIAQLARTIGVELVAEGIEDGVQLARLRQAGCPLGQGFHFAPALPEPELRRFLASVGDQVPHAHPRSRPSPGLSEG